MTNEPPVVALRIGDSDRDAAVTALQEHHVAGRLDREEFDTRMAAALAARTGDDLTPLFVDLPAPGPGVPSTPAAAVVAAPAVPAVPRPAGPPSWQRYGVPALASAIWPLTILACIVLQNWSLIGVAIVVSMMAGGGCEAQRVRQRAALQRVPVRR